MNNASFTPTPGGAPSGLALGRFQSSHLALGSERGSIAVIAAVALTVIIGFGALAIDVAYIRLAQAQAQDIADASSMAALVVLRRTGDPELAETAARAVVEKNTVVGSTPSMKEFSYGDWNPEDSTYSSDTESPNAIRLTVAREDSNEVGLFLGRIFGWESVPVHASATSATRNLHAVLVMDITNSWTRPNFYYARDAATIFYDTVANAHGPYDMIGMDVFTGRYAWEFTPLVNVDEAEADDSVRPVWAAMETASKAGNPANNANGCKWYRSNKAVPAKWNDFSSPVGGCFADMPREYTDEPGTDHTTGMEMAQVMFEEQDDPSAYRAMVVLTDGIPNGISKGHGTIRSASGYSETRWREYQGPAPHSTSGIKSDSVALAEDLYANDEVNTWVVSFVQDDVFMHQMAQGDGYFINTKDASALVEIFQQIANSLPMAVVE